MKKYIFLCLLGISVPTFAQMVDLLGSMAIQGSLSTGSAQSVARGLSVAKRNQIVQDIQQTVIEIQTSYMGNYSSVNKNSLMTKPFSGMNWQVGSNGTRQFYIQLNQIDEQTCRYLLDQNLYTLDTQVNDNGTVCSSINKIKFIYN